MLHPLCNGDFPRTVRIIKITDTHGKIKRMRFYKPACIPDSNRVSCLVGPTINKMLCQPLSLLILVSSIHSLFHATGLLHARLKFLHSSDLEFQLVQQMLATLNPKDLLTQFIFKPSLKCVQTECAIPHCLRIGRFQAFTQTLEKLYRRVIAG